MFELTETLYLTEDRKKVVKAGDVTAAFLLGVKGQKIADSKAASLGLLHKPEPAKDPVTRDPQVTNRDSGAPSTRKAPSTPKKV